jgi:hypothetical protein
MWELHSILTVVLRDFGISLIMDKLFGLGYHFDIESMVLSAEDISFGPIPVSTPRCRYTWINACQPDQHCGHPPVQNGMYCLTHTYLRREVYDFYKALTGMPEYNIVHFYLRILHSRIFHVGMDSGHRTYALKLIAEFQLDELSIICSPYIVQETLSVPACLSSFQETIMNAVINRLDLTSVSTISYNEETEQLSLITPREHSHLQNLDSESEWESDSDCESGNMLDPMIDSDDDYPCFQTDNLVARYQSKTLTHVQQVLGISLCRYLNHMLANIYVGQLFSLWFNGGAPMPQPTWRPTYDSPDNSVCVGSEMGIVPPLHSVKLFIALPPKVRYITYVTSVLYVPVTRHYIVGLVSL